MYITNQSRIEQHIKALSQFTATPGKGVTRLTFSKEDLEARAYIKETMFSYGLTVSEDGFGNIFGKLEGSEQNAPSVLIGSHFDSVPNGGAYDGTAGVVIGLEIAALFQEQRIQPVYPLEVVAFVEEEGGRFAGGLLGSRAMMGVLSVEQFLQTADKDGIRTSEAMAQIGLSSLHAKPRSAETIKAYLELHIEQGPILEKRQIDIGIVEAIVSLQQLEVTIRGKAGHAGTTPMEGRADALVAAAQMISEFPQIAREHSADTVITTGKIDVSPNGSNVIPDTVVFSIDIRAGKEDTALEALKKVKGFIESKQSDTIQLSIVQTLSVAPKAMDSDLQQLLAQAATDLQLMCLQMNSGAGHDAMILADYVPSAMVFIPSKGGLSHCPEEWSDPRHLAAGASVLFDVVKKITTS